MPHPWLKLGCGVWVGLGLGLDTVGVIDGIYVVWCEKSIVKKVLVLVLAILYRSIVNNPVHGYISSALRDSVLVFQITTVSIAWPHVWPL